MASFGCAHSTTQGIHGAWIGGPSHRVYRDGRDIIELRYKWVWWPWPHQVAYVNARKTCPK